MAFVVSQGQMAALSRPNFSIQTQLTVAEDYTAAYSKIWKEHSSVRTVVNFLGRNIGQLAWHMFRRISDTDRERVVDHQLARLLAKPNGWTTQYAFFESLVQDLAIYDRFLALKVKADDGGTGALVRVPPTMFTPIGTNWLMPDGFEVKGTSGKKTYTRDQAFFISGYSPDGDLGGASSIESLRAVLAEEYEAARMRAQTFKNGARVSGYLSRPLGAPDWSDAARKRFREGWRSQYTGGGPEAGGTPVLEDGMTFTAASQSAKDLQYVESRKLTREEAASAFFIPPPMIGLLDHATFSNIKEQHKHLYQDTLGPWLTRIKQEIELQLLDEFGDSDGIYVEANIAAKLAGSFEEQAQQLQAAVGGPYMTRNEARARQNLPAIEGANDLIVPLNVITGGQASPQDSGSQNIIETSAPAPRVKARSEYEIKKPREIPAEHQDEMAKVFRKFFKRQRETVLSRVGAKAPGWWDEKRWNEELTEDVLAQSLKVSKVAAMSVLSDLGVPNEEYSVDRTKAFLKKVSERIAQQVNAATLAALTLALSEGDEEAPAHVFDVAETSRADQSGMTAAATMVGFGLVEAARQTKPQALKRWVVNSGNPRNSHANMSGEEVGIEDEFSNGLMWPGSFGGDVDEVANCQCSVVIIT